MTNPLPGTESVTVALEPLLRNSPGAAPATSLEFVFVGREALVTQATDTAAELLAGHGAAHHLYIGERGMGKTHLVSMIHARLVAESPVTAVLLDEEPWGIRDYRGLLSAVLDRIPEAEASLPELDVRDLEVAISTAAGRRPLVVVLENLGEIFGRIGADGRSRLRALLENSRHIALVATAAERPAAITRHTEPFFGFFDVTDLQPLTVEEVVELTERVARYAGHPRVAELAGKPSGRVTLGAIHALLGGQPRVWTILGEIASVSGLSEPAPLVRRVLDDLLPQYQDRVGVLPPDQQAIVLHLVEAGGALTVRQLAALVGLDQRSVSGQLRHLAGKGWVRAAAPLTIEATGDRRSSYYELREPLVRLCLQLKTGRGVPLGPALAYLAGIDGRPEPAGLVERAVAAFRTDRDRAHLMALPSEWRTVAQHRLTQP